MNKLEKEQILKKRRATETALQAFLRFANSDLQLADIQKIIYEEKNDKAFIEILMNFIKHQSKNDFEKIALIFNDAWNYFPHKSLNGLSPAEKIKAYNRPDKNSNQARPESRKLTEKQRVLLWDGGGNGPYSQAKLIREVRILDDSVSREFLVVEAEINPTTLELVKKHRNDAEFKNDAAIQELLDHAEYHGPEFGYTAMAFSEEYENKDERILLEAEWALERVQATIIKMHKFVMQNYLNPQTSKN